MPSSAIRSRSRRSSSSAVVGSAIALLATLGASSSRAQGVGSDAGPGAAVPATAPMPTGDHPFAQAFPNLVLKTHEGKTVRFYDDLLKGKIVLINFMYATCEER